MKLILAGPGAFGKKHLEALAEIDDVEVISVVGSDETSARALADQYSVSNTDTELATALARPGIEAAILATPTHLHASQAMQCMRAGKHVAIEIPVADNLADAKEVAKLQAETGLVCLVGHTRRYNPSHQWIKQRIESGELNIQHMDVQTFFFRRTNTNALGEARNWTDHLLWHHAAHSIDLFQYQTGEKIIASNILQGPICSVLGIAMDMSIQLKSETGKLLTLALSFNNDGPLGTFFRYICDNGTFNAHYDDLTTGNGDVIDVSNIDVSMNGIELQDRDFIRAIKNNTQPKAAIQNVLSCYQVIHKLETKLTQ